MNADGSDQRFLLRPGDGAWLIVDWSPDGRRLAFEARSDDIVQVWTADADGRNLTRLTGGDSAGEAPRWSPDGRRIAFVRDGDIWTIQANGSDLRNLTDTPDAFEGSPAWSPNGKRVLFEVTDSDLRCQGLATVPANGGTAKAVPTTAGTCLWAPDWQAKPKKGKGKARPAAVQPDRAAKPAGHRAKPAGHRRAAR